MFAVFANKAGLDSEQALRLASPFGGGIAQMREVCGAVCGMFLALGLSEGFSDPVGQEAKTEFYAMLRGLESEFSKEYETINCALLLKNAKENGLEKPCAELVGLAAEIAERRLGLRN